MFSLAQSRPLPVRAALLYLNAKLRQDIYITDMLLYMARGFVKNPEKLPRYLDLIPLKPAAEKHDYNIPDVINMFRGTGKLCESNKR